MKRRDFLKGATALTAGAMAAGDRGFSAAWAQDRKDTLLAVSELGPNSLDTEVVGANRAAYEVTWNVYDRLLTFGVKKDENGNDYYDYRTLKPELAEEWDARDMSVTFKLRKDAKFHDGTPVTAKDVKWSFDRAIGVGGYPKFIFSNVSMTSPEQFVVVDDHTFRFDYAKRDNYTIPYIASPVGLIYNSALIKKNAAADDPWGVKWTKQNTAGSGAYMVESWTPGQEIVFVRNDQWNRGPAPKMRRVIARVVPAAGTRRALLERGDVDFSFDIPPKDASDLAESKNVKVISTLMDNTVYFLSMNVNLPPFDNVKVRQAMAYAMPYKEIVQLALFGRGRELSGGPKTVSTPDWPQPQPYTTDLAKAKQLLVEAGYADGFETTLSYDLGAAVTNEPLCTLIQNNLAKIGVRVTLNKIPGASWRSQKASKKLPMLVDVFGGWLSYPYFYFGYVYYDPAALHNSSAYQNAEMVRLIEESHFNPDSKAADDAAIRYIQIAFDEMPYVSLFQPYLNVASKVNVSGFCYWFFRQVDYRRFVKA